MNFATPICCLIKSNFVKTIIIFHCQTKCNQYWPEIYSNEEFYSDIKISKFEEKHFAFHVIRKFTVSHTEVKYHSNNTNRQ